VTRQLSRQARRARQAAEARPTVPAAGPTPAATRPEPDLGPRRLLAEAVGTAFLVFFGVGVAALSFGFGVAGGSLAAGVVATAFAFGLVQLIVWYAFGAISGAHINPAVTMGYLAARRIGLGQAIGYWIAQIIGGIVGAGLLRAVLGAAQGYSTTINGLGATGYSSRSMIHLGQGGAFLAEVILTFLFVFIVLAVTRRVAWPPQLAGVAIGLALAAAHLVGVPLTGPSVNPARSIGPAVYVGHTAFSQLWLFILAPLVGGILAGLAYAYFYAKDDRAGAPVPAH
jgi:aquaporin Z